MIILRDSIFQNTPTRMEKNSKTFLIYFSWIFYLTWYLTWLSFLLKVSAWWQNVYFLCRKIPFLSTIYFLLLQSAIKRQSEPDYLLCRVLALGIERFPFEKQLSTDLRITCLRIHTNQIFNTVSREYLCVIKKY